MNPYVSYGKHQIWGNQDEKQQDEKQDIYFNHYIRDTPILIYKYINIFLYKSNQQFKREIKTFNDFKRNLTFISINGISFGNENPAEQRK